MKNNNFGTDGDELGGVIKMGDNDGFDQPRGVQTN